MTRDPWWIDKVGYQIYPRSFQDSNGDGVGDLPGIVSRLAHLAWLGVGFVWLSPVYASPMADNGYDISDYRDVAPEFGSLADLDRLIAEARARGIGIVMDLVVNHSSDRHAWFLEACESRDAATRDFYIWRDPAPGGGPPDDRQAYFGGPAWTFHEGTGQYYFHLFTPWQPDLNWTNPALRAEIYDMMRWWFDRGIAGFRMDVIDLIGKDLETGEIEEGPHLHAHLQEMHREALAGRDVLTIGESWNASPQTAPLYSGRARGELDMIFGFDHVTAGWHPERGKWAPLPFDLVAFKASVTRWQEALADDGWNSLFLSNHDLPRQVSRYGSPTRREASAKAIATAMHLLKGTPFVYQGEEIGMTNVALAEISDFRDVETLNMHRLHLEAGGMEHEFIAGANANGRDNARTPMQWDATPNAGFSDGTPWLMVNPNHDEINVAAERERRDGVLAHYRRLIALRREHPVIVHGRYVPAMADDPQVMAYTRTLGGRRLVVVVNWSDGAAEREVPRTLRTHGTALLGDRHTIGERVSLAPWESVVVLA